MVPANTAMRLRAVLDFVEGGGTRRIAGDEWLFEGPGKTEYYSLWSRGLDTVLVLESERVCFSSV